MLKKNDKDFTRGGGGFPLPFVVQIPNCPYKSNPLPLFISDNILGTRKFRLENLLEYASLWSPSRRSVSTLGQRGHFRGQTLTTPDIPSSHPYSEGRVLGVVEYVGEVVATFMGLNESKYQYVIDTMSERDWEEAKRVQALRAAQDAQMRPEACDADVSALMEAQRT